MLQSRGFTSFCSRCSLSRSPCVFCSVLLTLMPRKRPMPLAHSFADPSHPRGATTTTLSLPDGQCRPAHFRCRMFCMLMNSPRLSLGQLPPYACYELVLHVRSVYDQAKRSSLMLRVYYSNVFSMKRATETKKLRNLLNSDYDAFVVVHLSGTSLVSFAWGTPKASPCWRRALPYE